MNKSQTHFGDASSTPFALPVRKETRFNFEHSPAIHTRNNAYISHFFNALSLVAPITEGVAMRTVRKATEQIQNPKLKEDLDAFIAQEALHTREHRNFNKRLKALGYGVEDAIEELESKVKHIEAKMTLQEMIAFVVTGEHAIYAISKATLKYPTIQDQQDPEVYRLFQWHALEEMEHQSVCHDIYSYLYKNAFERSALYTKAYLNASKIFFGMIARIMRELIAAGPAPAKKELVEFCWWMSISPGFLPRSSKHLLVFLVPGFKHWGEEKEDLRLINAALQTVYNH